jgi:tetratricopeptide (TPR) repeat protein
MRLFRQSVPGDWDGVFARLARALADWARQRPAPKVTDLEKAQGLHQRGMELVNENRPAEAVTVFVEAIRVGKPTPEMYHNLAVALAQQRKYQEAIDNFKSALQLLPDAPDALSNLGLAYLHNNQAEQAVATLQRSLELRRESAETHCNLGVAFMRLKKNSEAIDSFQQALRQWPDYVDALCNMGNVLRQTQKPQEALECYDRAIQCKPDCVEVLSNRGIALTHLGRLEEAVATYRRALELDPYHADTRNNLGVILADLNHLDEALVCFDQAVASKPDHAETHRNRALVRLLRGDYVNGWEEYRWRWRCENIPVWPFPQPLWDGSPLAGRRLLLHYEQGLGDTLQFVRYAALAKQGQGTVIVHCQKQLTRLLQGTPGIDRVVPQGEPLPAFDVHAPLMDLPAILKTTLENIPASVPYLFAEADRLHYWRQYLASVAGFRVGIAWQGSRTYGGDASRSIPLKYFGPLACVEGVRLISLQKGEGLDQIASAGVALIDLDRQLDEGGSSFLDTAAVMKNLDLIITSDTSVSHLAGALGVPVWVALCMPCDWRFLRGRSDCPWYPTMQLFRQQRRGDWEGVFEEIVRELRLRVQRNQLGRAIPVPIAPGELIDKITILQIKRERVKDTAKLKNVSYELDALAAARDRTIPPSDEVCRLTAELAMINQALWQIEDDIRECERDEDFGPRFIMLARSVYHQNDRRAVVKREINVLLGSQVIEEKSYTEMKRRS